MRFLEYLWLDPVARAAAAAPADDEPGTEADRRRILEGTAALARGDQGTPMDEVLAAFGLQPEDFPAQRR